VAFAVPAGLGVQEGALVVLCAPFGIDLASALALGIIKRGRELLVGAPAIVAWAVAERHAISHFLRGKNMKERRRTHRAPRASVDGAGAENRLRVGVLVDLHWTPNAGGHVKTWERLAAAALASNDSLDLTVHFLGTRSATHVLGQHVRYRIHRPLFSTASLPFLSHIPDHTDLAPHNPMLTSRLLGYDVIHTTDGAFAAAQTAARVARWHGIPLTSSVHTTTPYYTRVFTAATIERLAGNGILRRLLLDRWGLAGGAEARMQRVVDQHHKSCAFVLASRADDHTRLAAMLGQERVGMLRRGIERALFHPARRDRLWLESAFGIARDRWVVISVGRLDRIKNVLVLAQAIRALVDGGAAGRSGHVPGRVAAGHAGARVRVVGSVRPARRDRGAVQRRAGGVQLRPAVAGRRAERQRAVRRGRRRDGAGGARRRTGALGARDRGAARRSRAAGRDGRGCAGVVARARPQLGAGAGRGSAADLAPGRCPRRRRRG
jgi:glycosyltransferase involved in cell wall biosynthesis